MSYGTKHPETLSHVQRITRLYRSSLRKVQAIKLEGYRADFTEYNRDLAIFSKDFYRMIAMKPNSVELESIVAKYEKWQADNYDPSYVIEESRPYSSTSGRYPIWSDDALSFDPFGYYSKKRLTAEKYPEENFPYYEAYPQVDSQWTIPEIFDKDFDTTNHEKLDAEKRIENAGNHRKSH